MVEFTPPDNEPIIVEGKAALITFIAGHTKASARWHKHLTIPQNFDIDGDVASGQSYVLLVDRDDAGNDQLKLWVFGRYLDQFIRCPSSGRWLLKKRVIDLEAVDAEQADCYRRSGLCSRGKAKGLVKKTIH